MIVADDQIVFVLFADQEIKIAAGVDVEATAETLAATFSEVHPLPGRDLMPVVNGAAAEQDRPIYLMTRDNILEGDTGASGAAQAIGANCAMP